jgi:diamine N-acetyltransferase
MNQELRTQVVQAGLPEPFQTALMELAEALERVLPSMPDHPRGFVTSLSNLVIREAQDPTAEPHWWEIALDLIVKTVDRAEAESDPVRTATERLGPLMRIRMGPYDEVRLREITEQTVRGICMLSDTLTEPQKHYVAPNAISLAQALFSSYAWFRAIYAGPAPVGFLMLHDDADEQEYFLWRLMIAEPYQGRGYGRQAIERLVDYVRTRPGAKELLVSYHKGERSPEGFYLRLGFEPTGEMAGDEFLARLPLD